MTAECQYGYTSTACCECASTHYRFFGKCWTCEGSGKVLNAVKVVLVYAGWFVANEILCEQIESLDIFVQAAQMASVVGEFSVIWPSSLVSLFQVAAIIDFDVGASLPTHVCTMSICMPIHMSMQRCRQPWLLR